MFHAVKSTLQTIVALLAEGGDRNTLIDENIPVEDESPSSRRAGIEISSKRTCESWQAVALLAEGGDRNKNN